MINLNFLNTLDLYHGGILVIMVGPPGAGKTTVADDIVDNFENFVLVSPDNIRKEFNTTNLDLSQTEIVFEKVYKQLNDSLKSGKNVVYDATNCRSTYRHKIINVCRHYTYKIICVMSTTPISECIKRNNERNGAVPEDVIEKMYFNLRKHPPVIFEGYDYIVRF